MSLRCLFIIFAYLNYVCFLPTSFFAPFPHWARDILGRIFLQFRELKRFFGWEGGINGFTDVTHAVDREKRQKQEKDRRHVQCQACGVTGMFSARHAG